MRPAPGPRDGSVEVVRTRSELDEYVAERRGHGNRLVLVPTMGALHEGHASLVRRARSVAVDGPVVVSLFVNPLQFGPGEDLARYPRTFDADLALAGEAGADVVFAPSVEEVYPGGEPEVTVDPGPMGLQLEGRVRPGHFRGVLTVVAKLLALVSPDVAVFGEKDYQQLVLVRRMVADLCLAVTIVGVETVREADGLALSSRNRYLDREQRLRAVALSRALRRGVADAGPGPHSALGAARAELRSAHGVDLDYLVVTDEHLQTLPAAVPAGTPGRMLIAARVGSTRLIDNLPLVFGAARTSGTESDSTESDGTESDGTESDGTESEGRGPGAVALQATAPQESRGEPQGAG